MLEFLFTSAPLLYAGVFVLGALIGSFLNVVILRLPPLLEHDWRCQCRDLLELPPEEGLADAKLTAGFGITARVAAWALERPDEFCAWLAGSSVAPARRRPLLEAVEADSQV